MREEESIQMATVAWLRMQYPKVLTIISPIVKYGGNARQRLIQGAKQKRMGYVKGTLDKLIPKARGGYHGLFIEYKKPGEKLTKEQIEIKDILTEDGYKVAVCFSTDEAIKVITAYLEADKC